MVIAKVHGEHGWFKATGRGYMRLVKFNCVKDWIDTYTSSETRRAYLSYLDHVCTFASMSPEELLALSDREAKRIIKRYAQKKLQEGHAAIAKKTVVALRSFFDSNDREIRFRRSERIRVPMKKVHIEHIPSKDEIYKMADSYAGVSKRNKAIIVVLFQSGIRANALTRLTYGMVKDHLYPEINIPVPLKITNQIDTKLSGYGLGYYYTFLSKESAEALRDYLDERKERGWVPKDDDVLFVTYGTVSRGKPIKRSHIWEAVKRGAEWAGLDPKSVWVHCIRKSFRKCLNGTPLDEDLKEALMGHKLPGSRGSYFDYHDLEDAARKYMRVSWTPSSGMRLNGLESRLEAKDVEIQTLKDQMRQMQATVTKLLEVVGELRKEP